jgi:hypothetical protein
MESNFEQPSKINGYKRLRYHLQTILFAMTYSIDMHIEVHTDEPIGQ